MADKDFDNAHMEYAQELHRTADIVDPTDEQCDRILRNVLKEAGASDDTSYAEGAERVKRLSSIKVVHNFSDLAKSRGFIIVVAACFVLVLAATQIPGLRGDIVDDGSLITLSDTPVPLEQSPVNGLYYTIEQPVPDSIHSDMLSEGDYPILETYRMGEFVQLYFKGNIADIDWDSVYGVDSLGLETAPVQVNEGEGWVAFELPEDDLYVYLSDVAGNRIKMVIRVSESES